MGSLLKNAEPSGGLPGTQEVEGRSAEQTSGLREPQAAAFFRANVEFVAQVAVRMLGNDGDVDDIVQEVFMIAIRKLHHVRDPRAIRGWLKTITVRRVQRRLRKRALRRFFSLDDTETPINFEQSMRVDAKQDQKVAITQLYKVLEKLPTAERLAWTLRHVEGEEMQTVADLCGCSLATAKRRVSAAQVLIEGALNET